MTGRIALGAVGAAIAAYGGWLLLSRSSIDQLVSAALWLGGGVVVHDALIAPIVIVLGWFVLRYVPRDARGPVAVGGVVLGSLTLLAVPVLGGWGRRPDNPTLLDRDYGSGWLVLAALVALGIVVGWWFVRRRAATGGDDGARDGGR